MFGAIHGIELQNYRKVLLELLASASILHILTILFKTHKLLKVQDIFKLQEFKFYFNFINNKLRYYLQNLPFNKNTIHSHNGHKSTVQYP